MIKKVTLLFLIALLLCSSFFSCLATSVPVTEENLTSSLQKFASSDTNEKKWKFSVSADTITITDDEDTYELKYNLSEKPTFTYSMSVSQGMDYEDFKKQFDNMIMPMFGYISVADIQGINFEDSSAYFLLIYLQSAFNSPTSDYVIVDDTVEGFEKPSAPEPNVIYVSEFSTKVMDYVNSAYKNKMTFKDSSIYDTFEWTVERQNVEETSCDIVSSLTVNLDADFSKLQGFSEQFGGVSDITKDNADLVVDLKVGQKCEIRTNGIFGGYELSGSCYDYKKINDTCIEITGTRVGIARGYIHLQPDIKKSIYINVEENAGNLPLDTISKTITVSTSGNGEDGGKNDPEKHPSEGDDKKDSEKQPSEDGGKKTDIKVLPKAGIKNIIYLAVFLSSISIIFFIVKLKKYKDIK